VGEDHGQGFGFFGADEVGGKFDFDLENVAVEEENGAEGLVLGGGGDVFFDGEVGDEFLDSFGAHVFGVFFVVEEDVACDPIFVGLLGADGVGDLIHEFAGRGFGWRSLHVVDLLWGGSYNVFTLF